MKTILVLMALTLSVHAQTFVNYEITNFNSSGNGFVTFNVPTNTIFKVLSLHQTGGINNSFYVTYPDSPVPAGNMWPNAGYPFPVVLGPAVVNFSEYFAPTNGISVLMGEFDVVNATPAITGFAVQPNGQAANIMLQTSCPGCSRSSQCGKTCSVPA